MQLGCSNRTSMLSIVKWISNHLKIQLNKLWYELVKPMNIDKNVLFTVFQAWCVNLIITCTLALYGCYICHPKTLNEMKLYPIWIDGLHSFLSFFTYFILHWWMSRMHLHSPPISVTSTVNEMQSIGLYL